MKRLNNRRTVSLAIHVTQMRAKISFGSVVTVRSDLSGLLTFPLGISVINHLNCQPKSQSCPSNMHRCLRGTLVFVLAVTPASQILLLHIFSLSVSLLQFRAAPGVAG